MVKPEAVARLVKVIDGLLHYFFVWESHFLVVDDNRI